MAMENMSPRSQASLRNEGYQQEPPSIGVLLQTSAITLENECIVLEQEIGQKIQGLQELKDNCSRQTENISKLQLELEHLKLKTYTEVVNRESFLSQYSSFLDTCVTTEGNMKEWFNSINQTMSNINDRQQFTEYKIHKAQSEAVKCQKLDQMYKLACQEADDIFGEMEEKLTNKRNELEIDNTELKNELNLKAQRESEVTEELKDLKKKCQELELVIEIINQQNEGPKKTYEHLTEKLAAEQENLESITNDLQTNLQEELTRKANLSAKLEELEKSINDVNISLREGKLNLKSLDSEHKQLMSEGAEINHKLEKELEEFNHLQVDCGSKEAQFCNLSEIDKENQSLKLKIEELGNTYNTYKNELSNITDDNKSLHQTLEEVKNLIKEKEIEKDGIIKEHVELNEEIGRLKKEFENNSQERNVERSRIDKSCSELEEQNKSLMIIIDDLTEQMKAASKDKDKLETVITKLKENLNEAMTKNKDFYLKLFSYLNEKKMILSNLKEQKTLVEEMVVRNQQDCHQLQREIIEGDDLKVQLAQLEAELSTQQNRHTQLLTDLQESHREQLELKKKHLEDLNVFYEMEFKRKEQEKLDAILELKENKARIDDYNKKQDSLLKEIKKTKQKNEQCKNLVTKLEKKLENVAKVATVSRSIKSGSTSSQVSNFESNKKPAQTTPIPALKASFPSPGSSSSSAVSFKADAETIKRWKRNYSGQRKPVIRQSAPKVVQEKVPVSDPKKEEDTDSEDCWGFKNYY